MKKDKPKRAKAMCAESTASSLPEDIVRRVNKTIGFDGKPYSILSMPSSDNNWTPESISTGCFCWRIEVKIPIPEDFPSIEEYVEHIMYPSLNLLLYLQNIRSSLAGDTATAYVGADCEWGQLGLTTFPCIVVAPTLDQFDTLRIERTTAANYDLQTNNLIAELMSIDQQYGIDIIAAGADTIEFRLKRIPVDEEEARFLDWLHDFAPDTEPPSALRYLIRLGWD